MQNTDTDIRKEYDKLNRSFDRILVYHLGIDAGFFAEYTYMIDAMIFCLANKIQFQLYADDANFGYNLGWEDFFVPFCPMNHDKLHHKYNYHPIPSVPELWKRSMHEMKNGGLHSFINMLIWKTKKDIKSFIGKEKARKTYGKDILFNSDIRFLSPEQINIPQLNINGSYQEAFRKFVDITWNFNEDLTAFKEKTLNSLQLPAEFLGCQLRGGDKITEVGALLTTGYVIEKLRKRSNIKDIFVLTDDYRLYEEACNLFPDTRFHTLCDKSERGYVNSAFTGNRGDGKRKQMYHFLTTIDILKEATLFAGSITTGPSLFLLKYLQKGALPVDWYEDRITELACKRIYIRNKMSEEYQKSAKERV